VYDTRIVAYKRQISIFSSKKKREKDRRINRRGMIRNIELFPHQRSAMQRMRALETTDIRTSDTTTIRTSLGLYTDKPGAGKSYAMLAHLLAEPLVVGNGEGEREGASTSRSNGSNSSSNNSSESVEVAERQRFLLSQTRSLCGNRIIETTYPVHETNTTRTFPFNLVLVPPSTFAQWETYVWNLVGNGDARVKTCRRMTPRTWASMIDSATSLRVLIVDTTAYATLMRYMNTSKFLFQRLVIDEADSIHVKNFQLLDSLFLWIITATPQTLSTSACRCLAIRSVFFDSGRGRWESEGMRLVRTHLQIRHEDEIIDAALQLPPPRTRVVRVMRSSLFRGIRNYSPLSL
jgi:hypothetical protein